MLYAFKSAYAIVYLIFSSFLLLLQYKTFRYLDPSVNIDKAAIKFKSRLKEKKIHKKRTSSWNKDLVYDVERKKEITKERMKEKWKKDIGWEKKVGRRGKTNKESNRINKNVGVTGNKETKYSSWIKKKKT